MESTLRSAPAMKASVRAAYRAALTQSHDARDRGDHDAAFAALERAHILAQRYLIPHVVTHLLMLRIGWSRRDAREVLGQVARLIATVPGFLTGWVPKGNPGGANVSALRPMPLTGDLAELLADYRVGHDMLRRLAAYALLVAVVFAALSWADARRAADAAELEEAWARRTPSPVADFGSTSYVEITPIVNFHAPEGMKSEPGVSYLVRTDQVTILFDLGFNRAGESPSPLEHNLAALGIGTEDIDGVFLSHAHRDHVGGVQWERAKTFSFGVQQLPLPDQLQVLAPVPMTYPGKSVKFAPGPQQWLPATASTGPISRRLLLGHIDEQALLINVEGRGLVAVVGCGHQTVPKLLTHLHENFAAPLIGLVGDVHYPEPSGRLVVYGIDAQRRLASGDGRWQPIDRATIERELDQMAAQLQVVALGSHDTSDEALALASDRLGDRFEPVIVGRPICIGSPKSPQCPAGSR